MPGKTNTDLIRALTNTATTRVERVDNLRREIDRIDAAHSKTALSLTAAATQITILEGKFEDLKKALDETGRQRWTLLVAIVGAIIGSILTLLANLIISALRK